jgi:hypothetical protein
MQERSRESRRAMLIAACGAAALGGSIWGRRLLVLRERVRPAAIARRARSLGERHGLLIGYGPPDTFFVPPYGAGDAHIVNGMATTVEPGSMPAALDGIEQSLGAYPAGFYARFCKAIFICGSLSLDGAEAGGTYGRAWIILAASMKVGVAGIFETVRLGVHHEFSSLIWLRNPPLIARWTTFLPVGWAPAANNAIALAAAVNDEKSTGQADRTDGFLSNYGATNAENDFNVYAEVIFSNAKRVARLAKVYPVVAHKTAMLMAAYTNLDSRFESVFQSMGLSDLWSALPPGEERSVSPIAIPRGEIIRPNAHRRP